MITDETFASLRDNDPRLDSLFFYLDDYSRDQDGDEDLRQAVRGNTSVTAVDVDMHLDQMTDALGELMASIGQLQNLRRLRCSSSGDYAVTMAALAKAVAATNSYPLHSFSSLTSLDLANYLLHGKENELATHSYQELVDALQNHPTLQNFNLGFGYSSEVCQPGESEEMTAYNSLTPLIQALVSMPKLNWVRFDGAGFAPLHSLTTSSLSCLARTNSLTVMEVHEFDFSPPHVQALATALEANDHLKVVSLSCHEFHNEDGKGSNDAVHMAEALRHNHCLEKLFLPLILLTGNIRDKETEKQHEINLQALRRIFASLEGNHSLLELQLTASEDDSVAITSNVASVFRSMLHNNYGLRRLEVPYFATDDWKDEIQLHMKLNFMGRGRLVRNTSTDARNQWTEALEQVRDDLSCLFHLLSLNPLLCSDTSSLIVATK